MIKNHKNQILLIAFMFIAIFSIILKRPLGDLDEIWNYNMGRTIAQGLIPYRDISIITTPLVPMINGLCINLVGNEVMTIRILAAILNTGILVVMFQIFQMITKQTQYSLLVIMAIGFLFRESFCMDYNFTIVLFSLIIVYLLLRKQKNKEQIKQDKRSKLDWQEIGIGLLAGLAILTKQSVGALLAFVTLVEPWLWLTKKSEIKQTIKAILTRGISLLFPIVLFFGYLLITNSFYDFIDYAVLGIATFTNKIAYETLFNSQQLEIQIIARLLPFLVIIGIGTAIMIKIRKKDKLENRYFLILVLYSLPLLSLMYPISDRIHFLLGGTLVFLTFFYGIWLLGKKVFAKIPGENKKKILQISALILVIIGVDIMLIHTLKNGKQYWQANKNTQIEHYQGIEIPEYLTQRIQEIDAFIQTKTNEGNEVWMLDAEAAVYQIPLNRYQKDFDMFLKGNIGKQGEQGQIEKIKQKEENTLILVKNDKFTLNWQTPLEVIHYVKQSLEKIGEISIYDVYQ